MTNQQKEVILRSIRATEKRIDALREERETLRQHIRATEESIRGELEDLQALRLGLEEEAGPC